MKKADVIVIAAVLAVAGVLCLFLYGLNHSGTVVEVAIDGTVSEVLPLNEDCEKTIITADGGENTLVIENGTARVTAANCPDEICVHHSAIRRSGESIICLPHRLTVSIVDRSGDSEYDLAG